MADEEKPSGENLEPEKPQREANGRFIKGHIGLGGRPKGLSLTDRIRAIMDQPIADDPEVAYGELLIKAGIKAAMMGDGTFFSALLRHWAGHPNMKVDIHGGTVVVNKHIDGVDLDKVIGEDDE